MIKGALIDFDGTLVDSHPFLYQVYLKFLKERGIDGTEAEFESLLGPSLRDGVRFLVEKYGLEGGVDANYNAYYVLIQNGGGELKPGVLDFLRFAEANRIRMGVVTSAPEAWVKDILLKLNVLHYFRFIVSGDELNRGKPAPDPYLKGIYDINLPKEELIAIEDTEIGTQSAESAGLKTYYPHWDKLLELILESHYPTLIEGPTLKVEITQAPNLSEEETMAIEAHFDALSKENTHLFNGPVYFYASHKGNTLSIYRGDYKLFLGRDLIKDKDIIPVSVCGKTTFQDKVLWGKRALSLHQFGGFWETVPSGGLADSDPEKQLFQELQEEANIASTDVKSTSFLKAVHNLKEGTLELLYRIELIRPTGLPTAEVTELNWRKADDPYPHRQVLPLSLVFAFL